MRGATASRATVAKVLSEPNMPRSGRSLYQELKQSINSSQPTNAVTLSSTVACSNYRALESLSGPKRSLSSTRSESKHGTGLGYDVSRPASSPTRSNQSELTPHCKGPTFQNLGGISGRLKFIVQHGTDSDPEALKSIRRDESSKSREHELRGPRSEKRKVR